MPTCGGTIPGPGVYKKKQENQSRNIAFSPRSTTSETHSVGDETDRMARLNTTCGNLDVHIQPLLRYLREHKEIWEGEGKEPVRTAKRTPRIAPVVSLFQTSTGGKQSAFRKTTDLATAFLPWGFGWGRKEHKGKGVATKWRGIQPTHFTHMTCKCNVRRVRPRIPFPVRTR